MNDRTLIYYSIEELIEQYTPAFNITCQPKERKSTFLLYLIAHYKHGRCVKYQMWK